MLFDLNHQSSLLNVKYQIQTGKLQILLYFKDLSEATQEQILNGVVSRFRREDQEQSRQEGAKKSMAS